MTLVELLVAMVLMAIIGTALVRLLVTDSRFVGRQEAMLDARQAARAAMNVMTAELRLVPDSGLVAASRDSIVLRLPYAFGVACRLSGGNFVASMVPTDSLTYATAQPAGIGWRTTSGVYNFATVTAVTKTADASPCTADSVRVVPGGFVVNISGIPAPKLSLLPTAGRVMFAYQDVRYKFAPSVDLPGRRGLWRKRGSAAYEELVAPFDTAARFAFLVGPNLTLNLTPPGNLTTVRGLELRLLAESEITPGGRVRPESFRLVTQVPFLNRLN